MQTKRLWIYDEEDTPMRLPLGVLVERVKARVPDGTVCEVSRAQGYGERINAWDQILGASETTTLDLSELLTLCLGEEEWFYELDAALPEHHIRFGLHDSTALFIEAAPSVVAEVVVGFSDVREADLRVMPMGLPKG